MFENEETMGLSELESIKRHVIHLSVTIGPRGSTTRNERLAAEYVEKTYREFGLSPIVEPFTSARSVLLPFALGTGLILVAEVFLVVSEDTGALFATPLGAFALVSLILELSFTSNPLRWLLPKGTSQNVSVHLPPRGDGTQTVVLVGHLDTHRTPVTHRSQRWFHFFSTLTTITFGSVITLVVVFATRIFVATKLLVMLSVVLSIPVFILFLLAVSADFTPYTRGANDNATGAAMTMSLAQRLHKTPLQKTWVWAVNTGCEEVGAYGATAWIERHRGDLDDAIWLTLDNLGGKGSGPCFLTKETLIFPLKMDPQLVTVAEMIAKKHPSLGAYSREMKAAYTDGTPGIKAGFRCLTFVNYRPDGVIPDWHQPSDVIENIDWDVVQRTEEFIWRFIQTIDAIPLPHDNPGKSTS